MAGTKGTMSSANVLVQQTSLKDQVILIVSKMDNTTEYTMADLAQKTKRSR